MALPAYALVTLAELKAFVPAAGTAKDAELERAIDRASLRIEDHVDRRLVFRAPTESATGIYSGSFTDGTPVVGGQPNAAGRTLVVAFPSTATAGTVTVTGTVAGVPGTAKVFDATNGLKQYGTDFFTAVSAITIAGAAGAGTITIGTSQGYIEYHTPYPNCAELLLLEWPIRAVAEVNEDLTLVYAASTALVEGTTFAVRQRRKLARISSRYDYPWLSRHRAVLARYSAGYFTAAAVPSAVKNVALELAAWIFKNSQGGNVGLQTVSDATGSRTYTGPPVLTQGMKDALGSGYVRPEIFDRTGERDFDLEAA